MKFTRNGKGHRHNCVFIDSSNPSLPNQLLNAGTIPKIKPPFPPLIDLKTLIVRQPDGSLPSRTPNAFIIYRKVFIEATRENGYYLPMPLISSMASKSWEDEPGHVKVIFENIITFKFISSLTFFFFFKKTINIIQEEYKRLSKEALDLRNELCPKAKRRRKREKWNIVSFRNPSTIKNSSVPATPPNTPPLGTTGEPAFTTQTSYEQSNTDETPNIGCSSEICYTDFLTSTLDFPIISGENYNYFTPNIPVPFEGFEFFPIEDISQFIPNFDMQ